MPKLTALLMYLATVFLLFKSHHAFFGFMVLFCGPDIGTLLGCAWALWLAAYDGVTPYTVLAMAHLFGMAYAIGQVKGAADQEKASRELR